MKNLTRFLVCALLLGTAVTARAERVFNQAELDALLAPVALYPDNVLSDILVAAGYPQDVREAAAWSRANPQLRGDEAVRVVENTPWHPSVKALAAFPEMLARMDESPQWLADLGEAYRVHGPYVMDTVQSLRQRARASGHLQSDGYQNVYDDGGAIAIAPATPNYVYVRYYDPFVVYGPWLWPAYRPIAWRPWPVYRTVVVHRPVYVNRPVIVSRPVHVQQRPVHVNRPPVVHHNPPPVVRGPVVVPQRRVEPERRVYQRVPESKRQPIVQQHYQRSPVNDKQNFQQQRRNDRHRG